MKSPLRCSLTSFYLGAGFNQLSSRLSAYIVRCLDTEWLRSMLTAIYPDDRNQFSFIQSLVIHGIQAGLDCQTKVTIS